MGSATVFVLQGYESMYVPGTSEVGKFQNVLLLGIAMLVFLFGGRPVVIEWFYDLTVSVCFVGGLHSNSAEMWKQCRVY